MDMLLNFSDKLLNNSLNKGRFNEHFKECLTLLKDTYNKLLQHAL